MTTSRPAQPTSILTRKVTVEWTETGATLASYYEARPEIVAVTDIMMERRAATCHLRMVILGDGWAEATASTGEPEGVLVTLVPDALPWSEALIALRNLALRALAQVEGCPAAKLSDVVRREVDALPPPGWGPTDRTVAGMVGEYSLRATYHGHEVHLQARRHIGGGRWAGTLTRLDVVAARLCSGDLMADAVRSACRRVTPSWPNPHAEELARLMRDRVRRIAQ